MASEVELPKNPRDQLLEELQPLYRKFAKAGYKPPFDDVQLVTLAVLCLDRATEWDVHAWIENNFDYYMKKGIKYPDYPEPQHVKSSFRWADQDTLEHLAEKTKVSLRVLERRQTRLKRLHLSGLSIWNAPVAKCSFKHFSITSINEARCLFRNFLYPNGNKPAVKKDTFFVLPAELRNEIYRMVLVFPKSGISLHKAKTFTISRTDDHTLDPQAWSRVAVDWFHRRNHRVGALYEGPSLDTQLGVLSVNRQMRQEALPVFWGINNFVCKTAGQLDRLVSSKNCSLIRSVVYSYNVDPLGEVSKVPARLYPRLLNLQSGCNFTVLDPDGGIRRWKLQEYTTSFQSAFILALSRFTVHFARGSELQDRLEKAIHEEKEEHNGDDEKIKTKMMQGLLEDRHF